MVGRTIQRRWGGDLRRAHIFAALAARPGACSTPRWDTRATLGAIRRTHVGLSGWSTRPFLASAELLTPGARRVARFLARPAALDLHDEPVVQAAALGRPFPPERAAELRRLVAANLDLFPVHVVPSPSFAELVGLDLTRIVVAPNGSDTRHVRPGPWPTRPTIGLVSAAAPNRGIEALVAAARIVRASVPDLALRLWLAGTDGVGRTYIDELRNSLRHDAWLDVSTAPYATLGEILAQATVLVVPHPANPYLDVAVPVKLLDSMAAGRPVVVTPRLETARIVRDAGCGVVTADDSAGALAAAITPLLEDQGLAARLGQRGRTVAEQAYDWAVISDRVADAVSARLGLAMPTAA